MAICCPSGYAYDPVSNLCRAPGRTPSLPLTRDGACPSGWVAVGGSPTPTPTPTPPIGGIGLTPIPNIPSSEALLNGDLTSFFTSDILAKLGPRLRQFLRDPKYRNQFTSLPGVVVPLMEVKGSNNLVFALSPLTASQTLFSMWKAGQIPFGTSSTQWKVLNILFVVRDFFQAAGAGSIANLDILLTADRSSRCDRVVQRDYGILCMPPLQVNTCEIDALRWTDAVKALRFGRLPAQPTYVTVSHVGFWEFIDGVVRWLPSAPPGIIKCGENIANLVSCLKDAWDKKDVNRANQCLGLISSVIRPPTGNGGGNGSTQPPVSALCDILRNNDVQSILSMLGKGLLPGLGISSEVEIQGRRITIQQLLDDVQRGIAAIRCEGDACPQGWRMSPAFSVLGQRLVLCMSPQFLDKYGITQIPFGIPSQLLPILIALGIFLVLYFLIRK